MTELPATGPAAGTLIEPVADLARDLGVLVCVGTYERGPSPEVVYNSSVLLGRDGSILGSIARPTVLLRDRHRRRLVTLGDTVTVCDTDLGRIGMIICFDGDYP